MRSTIFYCILVASLQLILFVRCRAFASIRHQLSRREVSIKKAVPSSIKDTIPASSPEFTKIKVDLDIIKSTTEIAIYDCGTEEGLEALGLLAELCSGRRSYDFHSLSSCTVLNSTRIGSAATGTPKLDQVVVLLPRLLPSSAANRFLNSVKRMEENGWLSTNPDSVDGLPSLHLNLVSNGKPLFPVDGDTEDNLDDEGHLFEGALRQLYRVVQPYVYETLLPAVNQMLDSTGIKVSDIFLRRYGQDFFQGISRSAISAHYDVFSRATAVVALDDVAADGRNGLFTTVVDARSGQTSNHMALRRFFPLRTGDCVVHTWDVLHGVDVEAGLDRTSLIVWFTEDEMDDNNDGSCHNDYVSGVAPWLTKHPERQHTNDVLQFVLASALSSGDKSDLSHATFEESTTNEVDLYLRSASHGNIFALTRIGSLCEEGTLSPIMQERALSVLEELRPYDKLPLAIRDLATHMVSDDDYLNRQLAIRFWLEGALGGNPLAQRALADEVMLNASQSGSASGRLMAAVLFALAAQQDDEMATESLARVVEFDLGARNVDSQDAFLASPVVQVAKAALG
jgi:hypothetical protein